MPRRGYRQPIGFVQPVERLVAAAQPKQIILFGSYARGDADDHGDIDLLVVERIVDDRYESGRVNDDSHLRSPSHPKQGHRRSFGKY